MADLWCTAALWIALALLASLISVRLGVSVALVEIFLGFVGGNFLGLAPAPWIDFLAGFGSVVLTFLAGAEIEPEAFKRLRAPSLVIGFVSFLFPFLGAWAWAYWLAGWEMAAAQICGIALSTTSMAVVYAVMVESGLNRTDLGKLILTACFVTDLGTVVALGALFADYDRNMIIFLGVLALALWQLPRLCRWAFARWGGRVSEPEIKLVFLVLTGLGWLAVKAGSEAVLPAYLFGMAVAGAFVQDKALIHRMRAIAFALLTPFFFLKAGALVSLPALVAGAGLIAVLLAVKLAAKSLGVWPAGRMFKLPGRENAYATLLMSTGLTFGSISALYGLTHGLIDRAQYSILVTVVIASAVIPTVIAQIWFKPRKVRLDGGRWREEEP